MNPEAEKLCYVADRLGKLMEFRRGDAEVREFVCANCNELFAMYQRPLFNTTL